MNISRRQQANNEIEVVKAPIYARNIVTFVLAALNILFVLVLFIYMNQNTSQSALINQDLELANNLNIQNQELQMQISKAQNLDMILQKANNFGLVPLNTILYIKNKNNKTFVNLSK